MKVYVVECGEKYEGGTVIGIYKSKETAVKNALGQSVCFPGGWKKISEDRWTNGCDYVMVTEFELKD